MNQLIEERRIGRFNLGEFVIEESHPDLLLALMGNFIIVRAESMYAYGYIQYTAYSRLFAVTDRGEEAPLYLLDIKEEFGEIKHISAKPYDGPIRFYPKHEVGRENSETWER